MLKKEAGNQYLEQIKDAPAWAVSLAIHFVILMLMASVTYVVQGPDRNLMMSSVIDEEMKQQMLFDVSVADQMGTEGNFDTLSASLSATEDITAENEDPIEQQLEEELLEVEIPNTEMVARPSDSELIEAVEVTGQTEHTGGVEGAMDRLTFEISTSLNDKPTLVVWLFDASNSLNERRETIAKRFELVYKQLGILGDTQNKKIPLETGVVSFGAETNFMTKNPVTEVKDLVQAIREIKPDESGKERVFQAVAMAAKRWSHFKTRQRKNMMMIIVTDEKGDDVEGLEETIQFNKRFGIPVYCVGNAALFGRDIGYISHTWEENGNTFTMDLEADQGPETVYPERLQLPFWKGNNRNLNMMSSSFGPYALSRLCAETGGLYLVTEEGRGPSFDPNVMRNYPPDYRPIRVVDNELKQNAAKQAVLMTAKISRINNIPIPTRQFRADTDNILRQQLTEAQKPLAVLDYNLNEMMAILERGVKSREQLSEPRWQASFDLAVGRVLAMRARSLGYNEMCAEMKSVPKTFENKENNHWELIPSEEISSGPNVKKLAKQALEYLQQVVDNHPGTPWAYLASKELEEPLGWEWREFHRDVPQMGPNGEPLPMLLLADEEEEKKKMMNAPPKPKNIPKL